ncbi:hypothetical protein OSTOST_18366 [Ostertagia ostertagi]
MRIEEHVESEHLEQSFSHGYERPRGKKMADILGVVAIIFFYVLILVVGVWAGRKSKSAKECIGTEGAHTEEVMLAGRNIGTLVGIFTMTASVGRATSAIISANVVQKDINFRASPTAPVDIPGITGPYPILLGEGRASVSFPFRTDSLLPRSIEAQQYSKTGGLLPRRGGSQLYGIRLAMRLDGGGYE